MVKIYRNPNRDSVEKLLLENQLPTEDISTIDMENFFGCGQADNPQGVIGLEVHGEDGLLRSLAVSQPVRGSGCGAALIRKVEDHARTIGINHLYLLTETAEEYFKNKGYVAVTRDMVSESIAHTREFSELCPASASVMRKDISS